MKKANTTTNTTNKATKATKASSKAAKAVETPVVETPVVEAIERVTTMEGFDLSKMLKFDDVMALATACGVGTSHKTKQYRIFHNGSSLHVNVTNYVFYMSTSDFERVQAIADRLTDTVLVTDGNLVKDGKCRPHLATINSTADLATIFKAIAPLNALR
jgi:hypothetical protein